MLSKSREIPFEPQGRRAGSTLAEFAYRIRVAERTARRIVERGEVLTFMIGGRRLIDDVSIDRYIATCKAAGPQLTPPPPPGQKRPRGRPKKPRPEEASATAAE